MIYQNSAGVDADARKYSCLFNVIARAREILCGKPWNVFAYNMAWRGARERGIISGDLNADGDYDDNGEDEIQDFQALFDFLEVPLRFVPCATLGLSMVSINGTARTAPQKEPLDSMRFWIAEKWIHSGGHFVQGDGTGKHPAIWDPVSGGSRTRRLGVCESLRVFPIMF